MKVQVKMGIGADELFESIVTSVRYDAEQARGKKVPAKKIKAGFTYQKTLAAKVGGAQHVTTKITEFEPPRLHAASASTLCATRSPLSRAGRGSAWSTRRATRATRPSTT